MAKKKHEAGKIFVKVMANAPEKERDMFKIPKVIS